MNRVVRPSLLKVWSWTSSTAAPGNLSECRAVGPTSAPLNQNVHVSRLPRDLCACVTPEALVF